MLDARTLEAVRLMVIEAFGGEFRDHDWDHALGGVHCIGWEDGMPIGHAAVVARRLVHGGRALRTGYVEGMAVAATHRRLGHGNAVMEAAEGVVRDGFEIGALSATDAGAPLYRARGWTVWQGPLSVMAPDGPRPTPADAGGVYVLDPCRALDVTAGLACDWRDGDVW
jgi:aminoglycoside 2'-N-acetyltransferase I